MGLFKVLVENREGRKFCSECGTALGKLCTGCDATTI